MFMNTTTIYVEQTDLTETKRRNVFVLPMNYLFLIGQEGKNKMYVLSVQSQANSISESVVRVMTVAMNYEF